jgi:hypothetical protein
MEGVLEFILVSQQAEPFMSRLPRSWPEGRNPETHGGLAICREGVTEEEETAGGLAEVRLSDFQACKNIRPCLLGRPWR